MGSAMKLSLSIALVTLLGWTACTSESASESRAVQVWEADQVRVLAPAAGKGAAIDDMRDFTLLIRPERPSMVSRPGFHLFAPRCCVEQDLLISGDWLGDDELPAIGYNLGPDGAEFAQALRLTFIVPLHELEDLDPSTLVVLMDREDGTYEAVPTEVLVNLVPHAVVLRASVEHFTRYLIGMGPPPDENTNN